MKLIETLFTKKEQFELKLLKNILFKICFMHPACQFGCILSVPKALCLIIEQVLTKLNCLFFTAIYIKIIN